MKKFFVLLFFIAGFLLYLHNFLVYPPTRGLDSRDHIAYIKYIAEKGRIPKASEGIQMYQPPFYYLLAAGFYSLGKLLGFSEPLKLSQSISLISAFFNLILIYFVVKKLFSDLKIQILVTLFCLFLPMHIYESPVISNEMLLSFLSTLTLYYFLKEKWEERKIRNYLILGLILRILIPLELLNL